MKEIGIKKESVLVVGDDKLAYSITVCLLQAGHPVTLFTQEKTKAAAKIKAHIRDVEKQTTHSQVPGVCSLISELNTEIDCKYIIAVTGENLDEKKAVIRQLERVAPQDTLIAINTESISLSSIHQEAQWPCRIIGTNWVEPAHTTYFLEIITNEESDKYLVDKFCKMARFCWQKDPYVVQKDFGIRTRMMAALIREACYLIENNYATVEDIDRACRNDAGYYLPFAGNFRYMDLMGTNAYGMVMKDLNRELSKDKHLPAFFQKIMQDGSKGMENNRGFYNYREGEVRRWEAIIRQFSYRIQQIIEKYPFNYPEEVSAGSVTRADVKYE